MMTLLRHYLRRSLVPGILAMIAIFGFHVTACLAFNEISANGDPSLVSRLMPKWMQTALNIEAESFFSLRGLYGLLFQHPIFMLIIFAVPITLISGFISGDVDKGSLALLLARPVRRVSVPTGAALVSLFWIVLMMGAACLGIYTGVKWAGVTDEIPWRNILYACANVGLLAWAVCGISVFFCSQPMNRGDATSWILTVLVCFYVWNFLAPIWGGLAAQHNYSLFRFLNPPRIFTHNMLETDNLVILAGIGFAGLLLGTGIFSRRDFSI